MASSASAEICNNLPVDKLDSGFEAECGVTEFEDYFDVDNAIHRMNSLNFQEDSSKRTAKFQKIKSNCLQRYEQNEVDTVKKKNKSFVKIVPNSDLKNLLETTEYNEETINNTCAWHLRLPNIFGHTAAFVVNDLHQGLLHAFLRHFDQLEEFISDITNEIDQISTLEKHLAKIKDVKFSDKEDYNKVFEDFKNYLTELAPLDQQSVRRALFIAQKKLFKFVNENKAVSKYAGVEASVNVKTKVGRIRAWFEVKNSSNEIRYMVLCLSKENFEIVNAFGVHGVRKRPVRTITTLWFEEELPGRSIENLAKIWYKKQ